MSLETFTSGFKKLDLSKEFSGVRLPEIKLEEATRKELALDEKSDNFQVLLGLARNGMRKLIKSGKIPKEKIEVYSARAKEELAIFQKLKFTDYVLIVWDVINFCRRNKIPVGKGRGSAAGCLIFYLIGVTGIDPIKYDLLFERFISPSRSKYHELNGEVYLTGSIPDVDLDIDYLRRHEVVEYLDKKYPNKTAKILNLTTLTGKNVIKEAGKIVYDKSESEMINVSEMVPVLFGKVEDISKTYETNPKFKEWCDAHPRAYKIALKLRNLIKNKSVHASGLAVCREEITSICPIELSKQGELVCAFNKDDVSEFMIKLDLLGLKTLSMLDGACQDIGLVLDDIDFEEPDIYTYLKTIPYYYGLFQLEGDTALKCSKMIEPDNILELSDVLSLGRPGAMAFIKGYSDAKKTGESKPIHPLIDPIIAPTKYQIIYQEQIMQIVHALGFTLEQGYEVVKCIGKKLRDKIKEWEDKIKDAGTKKGLPKEVSDLIARTIIAAGDYSFNKSHGISYGALAAVCAYLKLKHPSQFFLWALKLAKEEDKPFECIARIASEMKYFGIKMLPPDIRIANEDFILDKNGIRFGLSAIKGISDKKLDKLRQFNVKASNKFELFQSSCEAKIDISVLSGLIQAGALQGFGESRTRLVLEAQLWKVLTNKERAYCLENGAKYGYDLIEMVKDVKSWAEKDKGNAIGEFQAIMEDVDTQPKKKVKKPKEVQPFVKESRLETIRKKYEPYRAIYEQNSKYEDLANWFYERALLGFSYSKTLKEVFLPACSQLVNIQEVHELENKAGATFVGIVENSRSGRTKKGDMYTKMVVSDETNSITVFIFEPNRSKLIHEKKKKIPEAGEIHAFRGNKSNDIFVAYDFSEQSNKIYMKIGDLKEAEEEEK